MEEDQAAQQGGQVEERPHTRIGGEPSRLKSAPREYLEVVLVVGNRSQRMYHLDRKDRQYRSPRKLLSH